MNLKIAVPDNKIFKPLYMNSESVSKQFNVTLLPMPENQVTEMMLNNRVDIALITPEGYGRGLAKADFRIIPGPALATTGYTALASMYFRRNLDVISSCSSPAPDDFLIRIGHKLMAENFAYHGDLKKDSGKSADLLKNSDSAIVYGSHDFEEVAIDISEEWFLTYEMPLPLVFWVCRNEEIPDDPRPVVEKLASAELIDEEDVVEYNGDDDSGIRRGILHWKWTDEMKLALDQTLQFLFLRQMLTAIPAVKVYGEKVPGEEEEKK